MDYPRAKNFTVFVLRLMFCLQVGQSFFGSCIINAGEDDLARQLMQIVSQSPKLQVATGLVAATGALLAYDGAAKVANFFKPTSPIEEFYKSFALRKRFQRSISANGQIELVGPENNRFVANLPEVDEQGAQIWQPKILLQTLTLNNRLNEDTAVSAGTIINKYNNQLPKGWSKKIASMLNGSQDNSIAGGTGGCGYHAIKNVVLLLNALYAGDDQDQFINSIEMLQNSEYIKDLFGPEGIWRKKIERRRKEQLLEYHLADIKYEHLLKTADQIKDMKLDGYQGKLSPEEIRNVFELTIRAFDNGIMNEEVAEILTSTGEIHIVHTPAEIIHELVEKFPGRFSEKNIAQFLINKENCATYVNSPVFFEALLGSHNDHCADQGDQPFIYLGSDDLQSNELDLLITQELENGLLKPFAESISYTIIEGDDQIEDCITKFHDERKQQENICHVVFLCEDSHWIAFIINICDGKTDYIITDSLNVPRYGEPFVRTDKEEDQDLVNALNSSQLVSRISTIINLIKKQINQ